MKGKMVKTCLKCNEVEYTTYEVENKGTCSFCRYQGGRIVLANAKRLQLPNNVGVFVPLE